MATLWLLGAKDQTLVESALEFILALIEDGSDGNPKPNSKIQQNILVTFTSRPDETFFRNVYDILQKTKSQIKDKKRSISKKEHHDPDHKDSVTTPKNNLSVRSLLGEQFRNINSSITMKLDKRRKDWPEDNISVELKFLSGMIV
jgi:hypothetical protein